VGERRKRDNYCIVLHIIDGWRVEGGPGNCLVIAVRERMGNEFESYFGCNGKRRRCAVRLLPKR